MTDEHIQHPNPLSPWDELVKRLENAEKFALEQNETQTEINKTVLEELRTLHQTAEMISKRIDLLED